MKLTSPATLAVWLASTLGSAQNCPLHGPAYPAPTDVASPAFMAAKAKWDEALASNPQVNKTGVSFAVEIYSAGKDVGTIHRSFNTAAHQKGKVDVGPDTVFRVHSISKVITVYTILSKLGYKYWHDPVTKWVPELAKEGNDPISDVDWDEVTLGSLASSMSGISRGYALGDASTVFTEFPGLRKLKDSERVTCGSDTTPGPCTREKAMQYVLQTWPVSQSFQTPNYSNMAFQILAYAVEKITGTPFPDLVTQQLIEPLNLTRTFVTNPDDESNAVIESGWALYFGDMAPMGGYFSALTDLTTIGKSILASTLLPPLTTRKWLKPLLHTSALTFSLGSPWEILRQVVPVTPSAPTTTRTRVIDFYTKQGGGGPYTSILGLSPDHNVGISILTAGNASLGTYVALRQLFVDIWLPAAEQAAREQAGEGLVGRYSLATEAGGGENSAVVEILEGEPAICVTEMMSNGTDVLELVRQYSSQLAHGKEGETRMWLYPVGLVEDGAAAEAKGKGKGKGKGSGGGGGGGAGTQRMAFRGVAGLVGREVSPERADACASWAEGDRIRWGNYPTDMFIFEIGADGKAVTVEAPAFGLTLKRAEE